MNEIATVLINGQRFFSICNVDHMSPFLMSIVSDSNHWMFVSSNGGISAGRKDADHTLFPYYTDDKITELFETTGSKSIFQITSQNQQHLWEPLSIRQDSKFSIKRNLYKSALGNSVILEEVNETLGIAFQYQWSNSAKYGFVKTTTLKNLSSTPYLIRCLDGIQNIMPAGVESDLQCKYSNLVNAYKRNELHQESGCGIFSLSARIVDRAEPSEALKATLVWSIGLESPSYLLSSTQLDSFRNFQPVAPERDIKGQRGAYFVQDSFALDAGEEKTWHIVADVNQSQTEIVQLIEAHKDKSILLQDVISDIESGTRHLMQLNASSDSFQCTNDVLQDSRHYANVLFNIMRGGVFDNNYQIDKSDFVTYIQRSNRKVFRKHTAFLESLPESFDLFTLQQEGEIVKDANFKRLVIEYLPLKFSRRHGDPSRPWNRFSINTENEHNGSKVLDYEGNWRDIFQNWEALAHSFPYFVEGMIFKFFNASTFDGYNPYRVTKFGFDWETIEPDDPWSYIGYWGDHQIIYLLKLLAFFEDIQPGKLASYFNETIFVYANVPYKIKAYKEILKNPKDTIEFDRFLDEKIRKTREKIGIDGALLTDQSGQIYHVTLLEKILATVLAKLSNYVPEGGIWMNTQRPEWNDANNALVGNGVSMVTLYYLRRFLQFFQTVIEKAPNNSVQVSSELATFFNAIFKSFQQRATKIDVSLSEVEKKQMLDELGLAGATYRTAIYQEGFSGEKTTVDLNELDAFIRVCLAHLDKTIKVNQRADNLFHAYNLISLSEETLSLSHLNEMLEGQVAALSAQVLEAKEVTKVLNQLRNSQLYRADQNSYLLYPDKALKGFLEKNTIPANLVSSSQLFKTLLQSGDNTIIEQDCNGNYHFNGSFRNVSDLKVALSNLDSPSLKSLVKEEYTTLLAIYEKVFQHSAFTGRSGTFFGYEGLGSIYWHMVSKLLLATQECCLLAIENKEDPEIIKSLLASYYEIKKGIGIHKSPQLYGAFPTDPYSHTPAGKGAQQPGMTGQVKEDIISRWGELGVFVKEGRLYFKPTILRKSEFLLEAQTFKFFDLKQESQSLEIPKNSLAFTYCQTPVIYTISKEPSVEIFFQNGSKKMLKQSFLDYSESKAIFSRNHNIKYIHVFLVEDNLCEA